MSKDIMIIGAGMAGLACARRLAAAGHGPVVLDKGRGIGGRMATRRVAVAGADIRFDHGAQYISGQSDDFAALLDGFGDVVVPWDTEADTPRYVAQPGMSSLPRAMAEGLDIRQNVEVTQITRRDRRWQVASKDQLYSADVLVVTIPAPQIANLFAADAKTDLPVLNALARVKMAPCLTLMAAFASDSPRAFEARRFEQGALAWVSQESSKPSRAGSAVTWVAQANPDWSSEHIEKDRDAIAALMLPLLCDAIGATAEQALYVASHRWRYARVTDPLGQPFVATQDYPLYLGGDWCLGPKIQHAMTSGEAIAAAIFASDTGIAAHAG